MPKISIGVPVRNGGEHIKIAIQSILDQSEQDFEIIISDNDSNDGSSEYLKSLADKDARISYFSQTPPIRAFDNFHFVLSKAQGEYFMWAAHDDTRDSDYISRLIDELESHADSVLAFGDLNIVTPEDLLGNIKLFPFQTTGMGQLRRLFKLSRLQCYYIYGVWRTSALNKIPYFYCSWWPDLPMMLAAAILGVFIHVPGTKFHYLELSKSNLERIKTQDYQERFNLVHGVTGLVTATYNSCAIVGGFFFGIYAALLVLLKQVANLPGFLYRKIKILFS